MIVSSREGPALMEGIVVEMMARGESLLWRCLHGGPLTSEAIERSEPEAGLPWAGFRARNIPFLENLMRAYGGCAVVARDGVAYVGHLRFYPKAVRELDPSARGLCLQQEPPSGPAADFGSREFPPLSAIRDKTLIVHCMMLGPESLVGESLLRKGIGTRMALTLVDWAAANGWKAIEATAYEGLPLIYASSGQAGRRFWEKLGFHLTRIEKEPALEESSDFVRRLREEASAAGIDPAALANKYVMRRDLD